jgi:hypothetical protein
MRTLHDRAACLFLTIIPNDLDKHSFPAAAVELTVEDLLPGAKIQAPLGHCNHHLAPHDLPLYVRVRIVLARAVVLVPGSGLVWCNAFQPFLVVPVQSALVIIDENRGCDVHGVDQAQAFLNSAFAQRLFNLCRNVQETSAGRDVEDEFFTVRLHV